MCTHLDRILSNTSSSTLSSSHTVLTSVPPFHSLLLFPRYHSQYVLSSFIPSISISFTYWSLPSPQDLGHVMLTQKNLLGTVFCCFACYEASFLSRC